MENRLYVPLSSSFLKNDTVRAQAVEKLRTVGAKTVFLTWINGYFLEDRSDEIALLRDNIKFFEEAGFEVGVWIRSFGYGTPMSGSEMERAKGFTRIKSIGGYQRDSMDALCPENPNFMEFFLKFMGELLQAKPKMIMLDDDFCLSVRPGIGCFCHHHMALLEQRLGESLEGKPLEKLFFTGGKNRYRSAWIKVMGDSMRKFCRTVRNAVDEIDPSIRMGFCAGFTSWDVEGADALELTKILAGSTDPFLRLTGAPYWVAKDMRRFGGQRLNAIIEFARVQQYWGKDSGVEIFAEADSYPRNRHVMPANYLNCFGMAVWANGGMGLENYFYDYVAPFEYETGYHRNYLRHKKLRDFVLEHFANKPATGVHVYEPMRKVEEWDLPEEFIGEGRVMDTAFSPVTALLTAHGLPVCYAEESDCAAAFGQCIDTLETMTKKLIVDIPAALRLQKKGVDVGLKRAEPAPAPGAECFDGNKVSIFGGWGEYYQCDLDPKANVKSTFVGGGMEYPAVYTYHNGTTEFLVYAFDGYSINQGGGVFLSNLRRMQLLEFVNGICSIDDHPGIYQLCKKDGEETAILFENLHEDELFDFDVRLDRAYKEMELCGAEGTLEGNRLHVHTSVAPFGMFAVVLR
ncbi:MAG: hypothetical protein IKU57_05035 [Oscillospiraceae bacterium]|nr:hypothetical protein [Oscillospiraceae bacterium]